MLKTPAQTIDNSLGRQADMHMPHDLIAWVISYQRVSETNNRMSLWNKIFSRAFRPFVL